MGDATVLGRAAALAGPTATAVGGGRLRRLAGVFAVTIDVFNLLIVIVSTICR